MAELAGKVEGERMIYLIPFLNALFGWSIISLLFYFLFHPYREKRFFVVNVQGLIPKNIMRWSQQLGDYVAGNFVNVSKMKDSLLHGEKLSEINMMLEKKVDEFLREKLKEKIPVFSMFITEGLISKMKAVLMEELQSLIPSTIEALAADVEKQFDVKKMITEKMNTVSVQQIEKLFYEQAGKNITSLKAGIAVLGFALGWLYVFLVHSF